MLVDGDKVETGESKESASSSQASRGRKKFYWELDAAKAASVVTSEPLNDESRKHKYARPMKQFTAKEGPEKEVAKDAQWNHIQTVITKKTPQTDEENRRESDGLVVLSVLSGAGAMGECLKSESLVRCLPGHFPTTRNHAHVNAKKQCNRLLAYLTTLAPLLYCRPLKQI
jgi:hypothetical protein